MAPATERSPVGIIGLGIMGSAYAGNLLAAGWPVVGFDIDDRAAAAFSDLGGQAATSPRDVAQECPVVLVALPSEDAFESVIGGPDGLASARRPDLVICEMSTLSLETKSRGHEVIRQSGGDLLDCPVSGTGAQAAVGDLVIYASGTEASVERCRPVFDAIGRETRYAGAFGNGTRLKLVANLLVTIHNVAAAEALLLAERSGLDLQMVFDAIATGAGTSRMFEVRGPMMVEGRYEPATMKQDVFLKDIRLILDHARDTLTPTPLLSASLPVYISALAEGRAKEDTASVFATLRGAAAEQPNNRKHP